MCKHLEVSAAKLCYSGFFAENRKLSLLWQQWSARAKCDRHSWIGPPRKPYNRTKNYDSILCTTEVMANFLVKFPIFRYHGNRGLVTVGQLVYFDVSCFMKSRSGFPYTFCVYSPCSVNWNDCARQPVACVIIMWLAHDRVISWSVVKARSIDISCINVKNLSVYNTV